MIDLPPVEFIAPLKPEIGCVGRKVRIAIGSAFTLITPDAAADLQTQLERAEAEARGNALRGIAA